MRKLIALVLLFQAVVMVKAQSPYRLSIKMDLPIIAIGAGAVLGGKILERATTGLTNTEINLLKENSISQFDGDAVNLYSQSSTALSDYLLLGSFALPFVLQCDKKIRKDWMTIGVMAAEVGMLNYGVTSVFKGLVKRSRPYTYNPNVPLEVKLLPEARLSFFSGHTSTVSALSFFTAKVWTDYHPDSKLKPLVWTAAATLPAVVGYLRIRGGKHFPTDVMAGYLTGAAIGYFIPVLHRNKKRTTSLSVFPQLGSVKGVSMSLRF